MNTKFMDSKNSKTSDPHRQLLNLADKIDLKRNEKYIALSNPSVPTVNLKDQLQHGMKNLNYLMDHILYQIFKIILNINFKSMRKRLIILQ